MPYHPAFTTEFNSVTSFGFELGICVPFGAQCVSLMYYVTQKTTVYQDLDFFEEEFTGRAYAPCGKPAQPA